jgi:hypothetical protein
MSISVPHHLPTMLFGGVVASRRGGKLPRLVISSLALLVVLLGAGAPSASAADERLLAYRILNASTGGTVRTHNGAALHVPARTMSRDSLVSITLLKGGSYDFHINAPWTGKVRVTLPRTSHPTYVMHRVGSIWLREGGRGHRQVWVEQLSPFSWLGDKLKALACLSRNPRAVVGCFISKGITKVNSSVVKWLAGVGGISSECVQTILASKGWVANLLAVVGSSACTGHAGEGNPGGCHCEPRPQPQQPQPPPQPQPQPRPQPRPTPQPQPRPQPPPPPIVSGPTFRVMNTSEQPPDGVWFRNSPSQGDTDRVTGHGVYAGEVIQARCWAWGDAVGGFANRIWYRAVNVSRPTNAGVSNSGYLNTHYVNDGMTANHSAPGVPPC